MVATVSTNVRNTGDRSGDEVVQIFASAPNAGFNGVPLKSMVAYERFHIEANLSIEHTFEIQSHHFTYADAAGRLTTSPGMWRVWAGANGESNAVNVLLD